KYIYYFVTIVLLFVIFFYVRPFEQLLNPHPPHQPPQPQELIPGPSSVYDEPGNGPPPGPRSMRIDIVSIFLFVMIFALGMALQVTRKWRETIQRVAQAEADRAQAELAFLK